MRAKRVETVPLQPYFGFHWRFLTKIQSRLKFSISIEIFNRDCQNSPQKFGVGGWLKFRKRAEYCFESTVSEERTHWVLRQTRWVLRETRWVRVYTQIIGWKELTELAPRNSVSPEKLTEFGVWSRTPRNRIRPVPDNESYERENPWNRTISTVLWVHKKLPQSTVKLVLPSNESYESKTGCNRTLATVLWVPLKILDKNSISLEIFNRDWKFQSRLSEFPQKFGVGGWLKLSISLENFKILDFSIFGPEMAVPILWAPGILWFFLQEHLHAHKTPRFRWDIFSGWGSANSIWDASFLLTVEVFLLTVRP